MKKLFLTFLLLASTTMAADEIWHTQIQMLPPPTNPNHVTTKTYVDTKDAENIKYDEDGNITYPEGLALRAEAADGTKHNVLATDTNGNAVIGDSSHEFNIYSSTMPTIKVGGGVSSAIVTQNGLAAYATEAYVDSADALKANLVSGVVPDSELPAHVIVRNWGPVASDTNLVTLMDATVNDRAFVGTADPYDTYYLLTLPPTTRSNWVQASGSTPSGIQTINSLTGPNVTLDLANLPIVQSVLDDKANSSDLTTYAPLNSPAITGEPTIPTPPSSAVGQRIVNAEWVRSFLTSNLSLTNPLMDGAANPGVSTSVSRSDHVHPTDTTRASTAQAGAATTTTAGSAGLVVLASDDDVTSRDRAATPAGVAAQIAAGGGGGGGGDSPVTLRATWTGTANLVLENMSTSKPIYVLSDTPYPPTSTPYKFRAFTVKGNVLGDNLRYFLGGIDDTGTGTSNWTNNYVPCVIIFAASSTITFIRTTSGTYDSVSIYQ